MSVKSLFSIFRVKLVSNFKNEGMFTSMPLMDTDVGSFWFSSM